MHPISLRVTTKRFGVYWRFFLKRAISSLLPRYSPTLSEYERRLDFFSVSHSRWSDTKLSPEFTSELYFFSSPTLLLYPSRFCQLEPFRGLSLVLLHSYLLRSPVEHQRHWCLFGRELFIIHFKLWWIIFKFWKKFWKKFLVKLWFKFLSSSYSKTCQALIKFFFLFRRRMCLIISKILDSVKSSIN